jgi:hypothetical protein
MAPSRGEVTYTSAKAKWRRSGVVQIVSVVDTPLAIFPVKFLQTCGDNTWSYILFVVKLLIEEDSHHPGALYNHAGQPVSPEATPISGVYRLIENGKPPLFRDNYCRVMCGFAYKGQGRRTT